MTEWQVEPQSWFWLSPKTIHYLMHNIDECDSFWPLCHGNRTVNSYLSFHFHQCSKKLEKQSASSCWKREHVEACVDCWSDKQRPSAGTRKLVWFASSQHRNTSVIAASTIVLSVSETAFLQHSFQTALFIKCETEGQEPIWCWVGGKTSSKRGKRRTE